jgi:CubicO group peptidase (beta-lactamase class C family)
MSPKLQLTGLALVLGFVRCLCAQPVAPADPFAGFDAYVEKLRHAWKVPGVAVAVVKGGKVALARGYGRRNEKDNLPVTPDTRFGIGSISKSFTVALLGILVGEGKLDWDRPVRDYVPEFRLADDYAGAHITARDLVTHRSGLPRHDPAWFNADFSRAELVRRLRYLEPSKGLREAYQYNNLMLVAAGHLAERLEGSTWEELVRRQLFEPLGMDNPNFLIPRRPRGADHASPYQEDDEHRVRELPFPNLNVIGPAGSIASSANDMARYVLMYLGKGRWQGKQVVPGSQVAQMQLPQMALRAPTTFPEIGHTDYGLGLRLTPYRGHKLVHHAGAVDGFTALVSFMPEDDLGVVVLTNLSGSYLPYVLSYEVYDRLLGLKPVDWDARLRQRFEKSEVAARERVRKGREQQKTGTHPSHPLDDYPGSYDNPGYGALQVERSGDHLRIAFHGAQWELRHYHYDVFEVPASKWEEREANLVGTKFMFHTNWQGDLDRISAALEPEVKDIIFVKKKGRLSGRQ